MAAKQISSLAAEIAASLAVLNDHIYGKETERSAVFVAHIWPAGFDRPPLFLKQVDIGQGESIGALFAQWMQHQQDDLTDEEMASCDTPYCTLQQRILAMVPITAADLARQYIVMTDNGASEVRTAFLKQMHQLAGRV